MNTLDTPVIQTENLTKTYKGVNALDSLKRGTSRAFARSRDVRAKWLARVMLKGGE